MDDRRPKDAQASSNLAAEGEIAPQARNILGSGAEEKRSLFVQLPGMEDKARDVLGLNALEALPMALAARAEELWRRDRFAANVPFTNSLFVPMGPSPDTGLLYASVATVVHRHEALRTRLTVRQGRAVQIVEDWKVSNIEFADVLQSDFDESRPGQKSAVGEFTQASMDLYAQDSFRCRAFRDENGNVRLGFLAHGFFADAWSSQLLLHEVRAVYSALKKRENPILKPVAQYAEYAQAQRRSLDRDLAAGLAYWHHKLKDMPPSRLPHDHIRETGRRGRSYFFVDQEIAAALVAIAKTSRVSLTLVLMAAYHLSIARWSGQTEIVSAAYTADRIDPRFQNTIGFLVTNMPVCSRIEPDITFRAFLLEFAKEFYGSYAHRELSCELYEAIFSPSDPFCGPVFNFVPLQRNFISSELHSIPAFGGTLAAPDAPRPAIYRELYLGMTELPNGILGKVFYSADRFKPEGMDTFIQHFRNVLQAVSTDPNMRLRELLEHSR